MQETRPKLHYFSLASSPSKLPARDLATAAATACVWESSRLLLTRAQAQLRLLALIHTESLSGEPKLEHPKLLAQLQPGPQGPLRGLARPVAGHRTLSSLLRRCHRRGRW